MKLPALCLLVLGGCGPGTEINSGGYDQSCTRDLDCTPVYQGDVCKPCPCPNTAVSSAQAARYEADLTSLRTRCTPTTGAVCGACQSVRGLCAGGKCAARPE